MKLLIMKFSPSFCHFLLLRSKYSHHPVLPHLECMFFSLVWETKFHTHTKQHVTLWFCIF
jgi:hypothetical protein